jgi:hypothetical protein
LVRYYRGAGGEAEVACEGGKGKTAMLETASRYAYYREYDLDLHWHLQYAPKQEQGKEDLGNG